MITIKIKNKIEIDGLDTYNEDVIKLKPHQENAVLNYPDKWSFWWKMRVGKTPASIRMACSRCARALIICPKSLVYNWETEIEKWKKGDCTFKVLSKEQFKKNCNILPAYDGIFIDECHLAFGNFKTQCYKAVEWYIKLHNPKVVQLLSGTPYTSESWSVYSYGKLLGKDWDYWKWYNHFYAKVKMGKKINQKTKKVEPRIIPVFKEKMYPELQVILRRIGTVIDLKDVADVPDDEDIIETFKLNAEQNRAIKEAFDPMPIIRYTRQHQIESGTLKSDGYNETKFINCDKDKRLVEIAADNDKLVIVSRYLAQLDKYESLFKGRKIYRISGQEKQTASQIAALAERENDCIVLVQGDTCAGYSLQSFSVVVFASMSYSFVNYDQLRYRTKNMEKKTGCTYIHLITEGDSIDRAVYDCVKNKQNFSIELFSNNK